MHVDAVEHALMGAGLVLGAEREDRLRERVVHRVAAAGTTALHVVQRDEVERGLRRHEEDRRGGIRALDGRGVRHRPVDEVLVDAAPDAGDRAVVRLAEGAGRVHRGKDVEAQALPVVRLVVELVVLHAARRRAAEGRHQVGDPVAHERGVEVLRSLVDLGSTGWRRSGCSSSRRRCRRRSSRATYRRVCWFESQPLMGTVINVSTFWVTL